MRMQQSRAVAISALAWLAFALLALPDAGADAQQQKRPQQGQGQQGQAQQGVSEQDLDQMLPKLQQQRAQAVQVWGKMGE